MMSELSQEYLDAVKADPRYDTVWDDNGWGYNVEDCWNGETDKFDPRKCKVSCPNCKREFAALLSKFTKHVRGGSRWVGCDHKEPYDDYATICIGCQTAFRFTTYIPQ